MEFGLLGPLEVVDGGRVVAIPAAKQRTLLACLLLRAGELVTVDELAEAIWGEALPAEPRRVVQIYVTRLRQLLGNTGLIQSRPEGYLIAVAAGDVDVGRFELLLERAQDAAAAGNRDREAAVLREALGLWRGQPLVDVPSETLHREVAAHCGRLPLALRIAGARLAARLAWPSGGSWVTPAARRRACGSSARPCGHSAARTRRGRTGARPWRSSSGCSSVMPARSAPCSPSCPPIRRGDRGGARR